MAQVRSEGCPDLRAALCAEAAVGERSLVPVALILAKPPVFRPRAVPAQHRADAPGRALNARFEADLLSSRDTPYAIRRAPLGKSPHRSHV